MGKVVGIDFGTKRTGIAITDEMQIIASGLTTIRTHNLDNFIHELIQKENITCFVVGDPKKLDGSDTDCTFFVQDFIKRLKIKYKDIQVFKMDERFTSKIAKRTMLTSGISKKRRRDKELVDKISATILLQDYIDKKF